MDCSFKAADFQMEKSVRETKFRPTLLLHVLISTTISDTVPLN
jgi:hypothetical protein